MHITHRLVATVCIGLVHGTAASQELAARPELVVGEAWTYQVYDGRFDQGAFTIEVVEKTTAGYTLASKDVTSKGRIPSSLTSDLNWVVTGPNGPTPSCWLSLPLDVGRTWSCKTDWINDRGQVGEDNITYKVVGNEKVTVKAGTFDAVKIVGEGHWKTGVWSDQSTITHWYAPQVRARVRYSRENWPKGSTQPQPQMELVRHVRPQ